MANYLNKFKALSVGDIVWYWDRTQILSRVENHCVVKVQGSEFGTQIWTTDSHWPCDPDSHPTKTVHRLSEYDLGETLFLDYAGAVAARNDALEGEKT